MENNENFNNNKEVNFDDLTPQTVNMPKADTPRFENDNQKGLKYFCIALAAVVVLSCFTAGGYFLGLNKSNNKMLYSATELELVNKPTDSNSLTPAGVYKEYAKTIVGILVYNSNGDAGQASGVVYSKDGYIVTNDHIYSSIPAAKFKVYTEDGNEYNAVYVAGDTRSDLAIIKITDSVSLTPAIFGDSEQVITGESVCAIGKPNGYNLKSTLTSGTVSVTKVRQSITSSYSTNFIQTDTPINPGNSGGGLFNMYGQIIGITSSKITGAAYEGLGFAIPSRSVKRIVESLIEHGNVKDRARLGVSYRFYNSAEAEIMNLKASGLQIVEVNIESDLNGKISAGDIITKVNDKIIDDDAVILDIIEESRPGDSLSFTVVTSDGSTKDVSAVLLADEGSSSYSNELKPESNNSNNNGIFDFPEGY